MNNAYILLGVLQSHAPTGSAQAACAELYHRAYAAGAPQEMVELTMVGAISDGLRYGNWPWSTTTEEIEA